MYAGEDLMSMSCDSDRKTGLTDVRVKWLPVVDGIENKAQRQYFGSMKAVRNPSSVQLVSALRAEVR